MEHPGKELALPERETVLTKGTVDKHRGTSESRTSQPADGVKQTN